MVDGEDGVHVRSNDFSRYRVTGLTPSHALFGGVRSTPQTGDESAEGECHGIRHDTRATTEVVTTNMNPHQHKQFQCQAMNLLRVRVMASAMTREQRLKSLLRT
ncbi:hypothetical protein NG799_20055 [Laspinema sp. D1]|uniref:Uncharacterized protein n=1 Tax=Laspinema palackyanum D2a TaxID=2953684 RepID=A0ABT2MV24_9CYAN|nr:hypothetical protein [Laspinema sp. D2a]